MKKPKKIKSLKTLNKMDEFGKQAFTKKKSPKKNKI